MSRPPYGWHGRYLRIDVGQRTSASVEIAAEVLRAFLGGTGLATWILHQETDACPGYDPLGPDAPLIFCFSPLVGSPLTTSAKFAVLSRSPLTGCVNDALSSSRFAISGKKTGYDAIVLTGVSEDWISVVLSDDEVQYPAAGQLRGATASQVAAAMRSELGADIDVAAIGVAGEQQVLFATISHDRRHAGRGGSGAVLGSKRIKSVCVRGTRRVTFANIQGLTEYSRHLSRLSMTEATAKYRETGTIVNLVTFNRLGMLPTRNFQQTRFEHADQLTGTSLQSSGHRLRSSCAACTVGCEHIFVPAGKSSAAGVRLEYESLYALGPMCGVSDPEMVLRAAALCDDYGMDTISAGATIAFAMECAERGLLPDGSPAFGSGESVIRCLEQMSVRSGFGALLADGSRRAAEQIGQGSADFAPHVKGLELPGYDPRAMQLMALGFAVGTRGADHNRSGAYEADLSTKSSRLDATDANVALAVQSEDESALMDSLILCRFLRHVFPDRVQAMAEMAALTTGVDFTRDELCRVAQRVVDCRKLFNIRHGWSPADDTLPKRMLQQPVASGSRDDVLLTPARLERLIREYYRRRGWAADGFLPADRTAQRRTELMLAPEAAIHCERPANSP